MVTLKAVVTMSLTFEVKNYRGLRDARIRADGVCLLVGPSASGKSSLLRAMMFFRNLLLRGLGDAITLDGGAVGLRHQDAEVADARGAFVSLNVSEDFDGGSAAEWRLQLGFDGGVPNAYVGEVIRFDAHDVERREPFLAGPNPQLGPALRNALDASATTFPPPIHELAKRITSIRRYGPWETNRARRAMASPSEDDLYLHPAGNNLYLVLQNWRDDRRYRSQYEWVVERMKRLFVDVFADFDFSKPGGGLVGRFYRPGKEEPLPMSSASDGMLTAMLHLTCAAGMQQNGTLLIDEPENGLHPAALRGILDAFREQSEERGFDVILATHSTVLLDAFSDDPSRVLVTEPAEGEFPAQLTKLHSEEWLANFRLGQIYGVGYGKQATRSDDVRESDT